MPGTEDHARARAAVDLEPVHARAVRVAVDHEAHAGAAEYRLDGRRVDVGDVAARICEVLAAALAGFGGKPAPCLDRQPREAGPQNGITHQRAQPLVRAVVDAKSVAVADRDPLARNVEDGRVVEQGRAGFTAEPLSQHEVAIASHHVNQGAGSRQCGEPFDHRPVRRFRVVVANPGLEQVTEQEQGSCALDRARQEAQEPGGDLGRRGVEVQVRGEPDGHRAGSTFASAGGWVAGATAAPDSTT